LTSGMEPENVLAADREIRIAYLAHGVGGRQGGVRTKILSQAASWAALQPNVRVGVFVRCDSGVEADWRGQPFVVSVRSSRAGIAGRFIQRELLSMELLRWRPDLIYLRQSTVSPSIVALASLIPTVVELNTLDLAELRLRSPNRYRYAALTRGLVLRRARGLVAVAREIATHETVRRLRRPTATIPNGIDLRRYEWFAPPVNETPRLVFLGTPQTPWHGVDRVGELARHFPEWTFDLIGPSGDELGHRPSNVQVHGLCDPSEYLPLLARADVAIGPLALYRNSMAEASPLKVGEYLAHGIPVIAGYSDTRFPRGAPFLLQIPNAEDGVASSLDRIREFVLRWKGNRVLRNAVASIDTQVIERQRLDFLMSTIEPAHSG